jgi:hypothetical protein
MSKNKRKTAGAKKTQYPIAEELPPKLSDYQIALAYWENEKYMFPESMWADLEPKPPKE